jgi:uncharacterized protein (DUF427 family)
MHARIRNPNLGHSITIEISARRLIARLDGQVIAWSRRALILIEPHALPIHYFPHDDIASGLLERTSLLTYCPYKGRAAHYSLSFGRWSAVNAAWRYEDPYPAVARIRDHIAFHPRCVEILALAGAG